MKRLLEHGQVKEALEFIRRDDERTLAEQLVMCGIPAPSCHEEERAEYVKAKFEEIGLENVHMDQVRNVFGTISGTGQGPTIMLAAHLDTVFPMKTDVTVRKEGNIYRCPGISDDTRAVAELFTIARAMKASGLRPQGDLIFCADVCEEGLGDLRGVKHIFQNSDRIDGFVSIDDTETGGIVYKAVGSVRYEVVFTGRGGHSFRDFGLPNPVHAMGRAIQKISDFQVPQSPRTTFNVGVIQGGTSVNTISGSASMLVDLRSVDPRELEKLSAEMKLAVEQAVKEENSRWKSEEKVQAEIRKKGERPAGAQDEDCPAVRAAKEAAVLAGIESKLLEACSTDANIPISMGIPALTVGRGGKGGGTHSIYEWFEPAKAWLGPQRDLLLVLGLGGLEGCVEPALPVRNAFSRGAKARKDWPAIDRGEERIC